MIELLHPLRGMGVTTQTFDEHVSRARQNGWCTKPGACPGGIYYFGGHDWGIEIGTAVVAASDEEVIRAGWDAGYGVYIRSRNGDYDLIYAHLTELGVRVGDMVDAGQVIGRSGNSGNSTGPHLHFEVRYKGTPVDPLPMIVGASPALQAPPLQGAGFEGRIPAEPVLPEGETLYSIKVRYGPGLEAQWSNAVIEEHRVVKFTRFAVLRGVELWGCIGGMPEQWMAIYHGDRWLVRLAER